MTENEAFALETRFGGVETDERAQHTRPVDRVTATAWSPGLRRNIGYVWVPIEVAGPNQPLHVESEHGKLTGLTATIPFVDPDKERPAQPLRHVST